MIRLFDRSVLVGVSVAALAVALAGLWLKHDAPRVDDQMQSARQRDLVSAGPVREQPVPAAPIVQTPSVASDVQEESKSPPEANRPDAEARPAPAAKSVRSDRPSSAKAQAKRSARLRDDVAQAHKPTTASQPPPAREADPLPVNEPQAAETAKPAVLPSEPPLSNTTAPEPVRSTPSIETSAGPKTRKQVEDELRAARSSGALPRFGNPDPAGPGGSPGNLNR
ncbi:hypothetical protein [Caballeronia sp. LZ035]|uniref:hypothetical protein n=1 Tax=Caballeronia sp. LZ035 TaxID=3038568 RepID=UPI0028590B1A|nr:hypothetical protein [Caballeronia sp. LZ035]MDR5758645.1 hypothetical protein [Caballeronia sp. LZ035]